MKRFFKVGLPCLLLAFFAPVLWSIMRSHDDDSQGVLEADAETLQTTCVSPHLEAPIQEGESVLWCGTFQLAWNEVCTLVGEDLQFVGQQSAMVAALNKQAFVKEDLDEAACVALADFVRNDVHARISRELKAKFHGRASPKALPSPLDAPRPQDIVAYAYLFKNFEFSTPFERLELPLRFAGTEVASFGIGEEYKSSQAKLCDQVVVHDYKSPDDFVIELLAKSEGDHVVLAKTDPRETLEETIAAVEQRIARAQSAKAVSGDILKVPKFNFDITRRYTELPDSPLRVANPNIAKDLRIISAVQNIRFQMDEKGVKLKSDSHISFGCGDSSKKHGKRVMIFDKPFLLMLKRTDAQSPYFALWVGNAELLQRGGA